MSTAMPRETDPRKGRFGQRPESDEPGELEGSGYEAIVLERLPKPPSRIAGVGRTPIFVRGPRDPRVVVAGAGPMDMRARRTASHSEDVVRLACEVGDLLELEMAALVELEFAARLHDVGKIRVPDAVLNKPGPLDADESRLIRNHAAWGAETLEQIPGLEVVSTLVRFHHERWDGRGYPDGLEGPRIPLASRIIAVCDSYAAMTCDRPYRDAMDHREAMAELRCGAGKQFDPEVVDVFVRVIEARLGDSVEAR